MRYILLTLGENIDPSPEKITAFFEVADLVCVTQDGTEMIGRVFAIDVLDPATVGSRQGAEAAEDQAAQICADIIHKVVDQRRRKN